MHISDPLIQTYIIAGGLRDLSPRQAPAAAPTLAIASYRAITAIGRLLRATVDTVRLWRARRAALRELSALDDAALKDIGLPRGEIRHAARTLSDSRLAPRRAGTPATAATPVAANDNDAGLAA